MLRHTRDRQAAYTIHSTWAAADQAFITASFNNNTSDPVTTWTEVYKKILGQLVTKHLDIVQERVFGSLRFEATVRQRRQEMRRCMGLDPQIPCTYIEGRPWAGDGMAGTQLWTAASTQTDSCTNGSENIWTLHDGHRACGRAWRRDGATYVMLHDIHGIDEEGPEGCRKAQTARMFERAHRLLEDQGGTIADTVRTWIYFADLLDWYDDFNQVRSEKFTEFGILSRPAADRGKDNEVYLPASTGIDTRSPHGGAVTMDLLAVVDRTADGPQIASTSGIKQQSAWHYGSAFSRAMTISGADVSFIMISGTASINAQGLTTHIGDLEGQINETLDVVESLVAEEGATMDQIACATVFLKNPGDAAVYRSVTAARGLADLPAVCIAADLCRYDLLFEIDALVVTDAKGTPWTEGAHP